MKLGMNKYLAIALLSAVVLFLTSCATTSSQVAFHEEVTTKDNNDAIVYVYRLSAFPGSAVALPVYLDEKKVAVLKQNAYAVIHTTPGEHLITVGGAGNLPAAIAESATRKFRTFTAEPGGVYFMRCKGFSQYVATREEAMKEIVETKFDMGL